MNGPTYARAERPVSDQLPAVRAAQFFGALRQLLADCRRTPSCVQWLLSAA